MDAAADPDIVQLHRLMLGRDPGSEAELAARRGRTLLSLLSEFAGSSEFRLGLQAPLTAHRLPGVTVLRGPAGPTAAWAAEALPLEASARAHLPAVRTWPDLYRALFADPAFRREIEGVNVQAGSPAFAAACAGVAAALGGRALVGGVDAFGREETRGWAYERDRLDEPVVVRLRADGRVVGETATRLFRRDLQDRVGGAGRYGFAFLAGDVDPFPRDAALEVVDARSGVGIAAARLDGPPDPGAGRRFVDDLEQARAALGRLDRHAAGLEAAATFPLSEYGAWARAYGVETFRAERARADAARGWSESPRIGLLIGPVRRALDHLPLLQALAAQEIPGWSAVLLAPPGEAEAVGALIAGADPVVRARCAVSPADDDDAGRAAALAALDGDHVLLLEGGDTLAPSALFAFGRALRADPAPRLLYTDDDRFETGLDGALLRSAPRLRGAFDPDLLLQIDALGPVLCVRRRELERALAAGGSLGPDRRHDLALRLLEEMGPEAVAHVPGVLAHLRAAEPAPAARADAERGRRLADVAAHLARTRSDVTVEIAPDPLHAPDRGALRLRRPAPAGATATVIVPTRDRLDLLGPCLASLERNRADNVTRMDVVVVDNGGEEADALEHLARGEATGAWSVIRSSAPFNFAALNNLAARRSAGDVLVMLNNDVEVLTPGWLDALAAHALRPEVGAVGARLVYADLTIQHAGVVTGGVHELTAHEGVGDPASDGGYMGRHALTRRVSAVTGACLATRRSVWERLGGLDAARFAVDGNDVDYCLRAQDAGLAVIYTPDATLFHHESKSRGFNVRSEASRLRGEAETARLRARWGPRLARDPYYPGVFDRGARPFQRLGPPPARGCDGRPGPPAGA